MKHKLLYLMAFVVVGGAGLWWYQTHPSDADAAPATIAVARGDLDKSVLASGTIEAAQLVSVGARVSGQIRTLAVGLGQTVAEGDLIAEIDSVDQQNEVLRAKASLKQTQAQIDAKKASIRVAELTLARQVTLNSRALSTDETRDSAEANLAVARAELTGLEAQLEQAKVTLATAETGLERTRIVAPIAGTVVAVVTEQGTMVNANTSSPTIVKLAQLDRMVVKAEISEADVILVTPGLPSMFTLTGSMARPFEATLRAIAPAPAGIKEADTISSGDAIYYDAFLDVDNPDGILRIGLSAEVTITLDERKDVLTIPVTAIRRLPERGRMVQVYDPVTKTVSDREIKIGLSTNVLAEVTSGLEEGDLVVLSGASATSARAGSSSSSSGPRRPSSMMGF